MTNMMAQPPERTAKAAELAQETTRLIPCECGARTGYSCDGHGGMHLGRYAIARHLGRLTVPQMDAVLAAAGPVLTALTIVRLPSGGAR